MQIETILFIIILTITIPLSFYFFIPFFFGAPYEKSKEKQINTILKFSRNSKYAAELGSGNAEIAIRLAKKGIKVDCYEINPFLVLLTKIKIRKLKLNDKIKIIWGNFFDYNFSKYDTIIMFQFSTIMKKLEEKIKRETKKTKVISNHWKFPKTKETKKENDVRLYQINE